ncbi:hypothetical protein UN67_17845, partial [Vibrio cholerae O1 biovar El Tor]
PIPRPGNQGRWGNVWDRNTLREMMIELRMAERGQPIQCRRLSRRIPGGQGKVLVTGFTATDQPQEQAGQRLGRGGAVANEIGGRVPTAVCLGLVDTHQMMVYPPQQLLDTLVDQVDRT